MGVAADAIFVDATAIIYEYLCDKNNAIAQVQGV